MTKQGFIAAESRVSNPGEHVADFDGRELNPTEIEETVMSIFSSQSALVKGRRYQIIGLNGQLLTISYHPVYERIKLHFEYDLT